MKYFAIFGSLIMLASAPAKAICIIEPLEPQLRDADIVYVGTVVRSELASNLETLRAAKDQLRDQTVIKHTLESEITLKGDPSEAPTILSAWQYNNPRKSIHVDVAERSVLMPGDTLLVVEKSGKHTYFGLCTATRQWNAETAKVAYAVFPPAP